MSEQSPSVTQLLARLIPYIRKDLFLYSIAFIAAPLTTLAMVARPWLLKLAFDSHLAQGDLPGVLYIANLYLGAVLIGFVLESVYFVAISYAAMKTITILRLDVYAHTLRLSRSFFDKQPTGRLLTRVSSDVDALGETLTAGAISIVLDVLLVLGILAAMFSMDAKLTGILLLVGPPFALLLDVVRRIMRRLYTEVRTALAALNAYLSERISGLEVVQLYRDEARTLAEFDERLALYRDTTIRTNYWDAFLFAVVDGLSSFCMALLLWYAAGSFGVSLVSAGLLAAFIEYIRRLFEPIREFSQKLATIQRAAAALEKIFGLLDIDERISFGDKTLDRPLDELVVDGLTFGYGPGERVLDGVSFTVRAGETLAIVGRTGSGKSTIGRLLTRAYQGYGGSVTFNGEEVTTLTEPALRRALGVVQQDVQLFQGSVRFNLTLGSDLSDADLNDAIDACRARSVVDRLGGLDGRITQKGQNVSVGESQLLSFARTLAADTPMVILDEATANVDSITEAKIQAATDVLLARRTVIVIAHRLSTVMRADRIVVLDAGRVLESGSHAELMARRGPYFELFASQFDDVAQPED